MARDGSGKVLLWTLLISGGLFGWLIMHDDTDKSQRQPKRPAGQSDEQRGSVNAQIGLCRREAVQKPVSADEVEVFTKQQVLNIRIVFCMRHNGFRVNNACDRSYGEGEPKYLEDCWEEATGPEPR